MKFPKMHGHQVLKPSRLQPIVGLIPEALPTKKVEKNKFVSFKLTAHAGQPATRSTMCKKYIPVFEEGMPYQWIELVKDLAEIWTQNSVNGPTDRAATIRALLKCESLAAFKTALKDVRANLDPDKAKPLQLTTKIIKKSLAQVAHSVLPHSVLVDEPRDAEASGSFH